MLTVVATCLTGIAAAMVLLPVSLQLTTWYEPRTLAEVRVAASQCRSCKTRSVDDSEASVLARWAAGPSELVCCREALITTATFSAAVPVEACRQRKQEFANLACCTSTSIAAVPQHLNVRATATFGSFVGRCCNWRHLRSDGSCPGPCSAPSTSRTLPTQHHCAHQPGPILS